MNKHRPILFSTAMVQAILEGRKTQTRRTVKPQPDSKATLFSYQPDQWPKKPWIAKFKFKEIEGAPYYEVTNDYKCPYGEPGDILYVRETWKPENMKSHDEYLVGVRYKADDSWKQIPIFGPVYNAFHAGKGKSWQPSLFMPKEAARLFLRITDIRVERLQDISEEDCLKEGIESVKVSEAAYHSGTYGEWFRELWQSINGPESWEANPWVWVVSFERTEKPTNQ